MEPLTDVMYDSWRASIHSRHPYRREMMAGSPDRLSHMSAPCKPVQIISLPLIIYPHLLVKPQKYLNYHIIKHLSDSFLRTPCIRCIPLRFHVSLNYPSHPHSSGKYVYISRRRCTSPCRILHEAKKITHRLQENRNRTDIFAESPVVLEGKCKDDPNRII